MSVVLVRACDQQLFPKLYSHYGFIAKYLIVFYLLLHNLSLVDWCVCVVVMLGGAVFGLNGSDQYDEVVVLAGRVSTVSQ